MENIKSKKAIRITLISLLSAIALILATAVSYVLYLLIDYSRIEDKQILSVEGNYKYEKVKIGDTYTVVSHNIGFGAYTQDFTFFMDGGEESIAESPESVKNCINSCADMALSFSPDFVLFQEVDIDSTRSYHIDQKQLLTQKFQNLNNVFACNYHSSFLMYPLTEPHGKSNSGLLTLSEYKITSSVRRSLPISTGFSKFLDLDRCYSVSRIAVEGGNELVLYNVHMSAYGGTPEIREAQMTMLFNDMKSEYDKGNYVVCAGDFNHDFTGDSLEKLNGRKTEDFEWAQPFPIELLPDGISRCDSYTGVLAPSCRNCDIPYVEGNFTVIVDGFLISDNVELVTLKNLDAKFMYSDHNPVILEFRLK